MGRDSRGDNLVVFRDGGKHCFACGTHLFGTNSSYHVAQEFAKLAAQANGKATLPTDFTREVPARAWQWILQYDLPFQYWKDKCGYSPKEERLVLPVGSQPLFSIGRYIGNKPDDNRKWYAWGDPHKHATRINPESEEAFIVLVEDLVSAHKVGFAGYECIPLFGTNIFKDVVYYLQTQSKPVILWLDKDQEDKVGRKAISLSGLIQLPVDVRITELDPKQYSIDKVKEIIRHGI